MAKKLSKFGAEFAKQRASGAKEFSFGGKKYNTKLKEEGRKKSSSKAPSKGPALGPSRADAVKSMSKAPSYSSMTQIAKEGVKSVKPAPKFAGAPKVKEDKMRTPGKYKRPKF